MSHFKLVSSTKASDVIPVNKYVSEKTGLTVIIANVEGPVVNGYFFLATEAHDDDGLPHTLEHLIFLGSKRYPYKGILDLLANRCMAHGTNAWTDTDHTCYTINTAGDEGMLTLLPIYLDHILNPTLTDEGFMTEVHHIDGEGEDAGVVYCEMQGRENTADSRCELKLLRAMYPNSGYSSETGGIMKNLRTSTTNTKVREFHKKFYRAENLTVILTGQIEAENVFKALATVEDDIIIKREQEPQEAWVKPWQTIPDPPNYGELREQWPADTEDCGKIMFGWRGPTLTERTALRELTACAILLRYLCDTAAAPLQRCLVEREDALAGDMFYNVTENLASMIKIELDDVPLDKLEAAVRTARECLAATRTGALDTGRLRRLLRKQLRETLSNVDSDPHYELAYRCIDDVLYSRNERDFVSRMNPQQDLLELMEQDEEYWRGLLLKYFTDDLVTVIGSPSIQLQAKMAEEEKNRLEEQRTQLGESGLAKKGQQLEESMEFNEREPPAGTLAAVPVPSCDRLMFYSIDTWSSGGQRCPHFHLEDVPLYARVHSLKTHFVYINLIFDTSSMEQKYRKWVPVILNGLAECPVRRGDCLVPHEQVIAATEELTVSFHHKMGFNRPGNFFTGSFCNLVHVETRCEPEDYVAVVDHLYEVLFAAEITKERLLVFAQRMVNEAAQLCTFADTVVQDILRDALYSKDSNLHWCSVLRQQKFLKELIERLNSESEADAALAEARQAFTALTENGWLHLATDFNRYKLSTEPWKRFARENEITPVEPKLALDAELISWEGAPTAGLVVGVGGAESGYLLRLARGPRGYALPGHAPLLVAINYFTQLEGPMWRLIRGCGLAYSYSVRTAPGEGALSFSLYRATNTVAAYTKAKQILEGFSDELDPDLFMSARSTALFETVDDLKCPANVVAMSLLNYCRGVGDNFNRELVLALGAVDAAAAAAARRWLPALFDPARSLLAVVCHPTKVNDMQAAFAKININLEAFESMEASHFNK